MQNNNVKSDTRPLVSVVIPCLNRAQFLESTIESILQQDYASLECIVVDGGSTDDTLNILRRYGEQIKWISEPDNGQADAINKGWRISQGEILAWLNADDMWAVPRAVSQAVEYLQTHSEVDVVYGDCAAIDTEGKLVGMSYLHEWDLEYAIEYSDHCIPQPAAFIRRHILEQVGWLDTSLIFMDRDLWYRIGLVGTITYIPTFLGCARRGQSYWHGRRQIAEECVRIIQKFYNLPDIPPRVKAKKRRAISNAYLRTIDYASAIGCNHLVVFGYALRAIMADPTNIFGAFHRLTKYLVSDVTKDNKWLYFGVKSIYAIRTMLQQVKRGVRKFQPLNLSGDRVIEWSWIAAHIPPGPGEALDFGVGKSYLGLIAAQRGFNVTAVDLEPVGWPYHHPELRFIRGDILKLPLPTNHFDLIINCSAIEHVGLTGRYGVTESHPDGDLEAMTRLWELLKLGGVMLLTVPVGQDATCAPLHRVYGTQRLPLLLEIYQVEQEVFWVKNNQNQWVLSDSETALNFGKADDDPHISLRDVYALGCFVLRKG